MSLADYADMEADPERQVLEVRLARLKRRHDLWNSEEMDRSLQVLHLWELCDGVSNGALRFLAKVMAGAIRRGWLEEKPGTGEDMDGGHRLACYEITDRGVRALEAWRDRTGLEP